MVALLLIISFTLHIIFFITLYYLYQQLQKRNTVDEKELEQILASFLQEIKLENDRLQKQFKEETATANEPIKKEYASTSRDLYKPIDLPVQMSEKPKDKIETSATGEILNLYHQGVPIEKIARKLNKGKTEVELIVKMNNN